MKGTKVAFILVLVGLFSTADSLDFGKHKHYVKRTHPPCMYGFNSTQPQKDPKHLDDPVVLYYQLDGLNDTVRYTWSLAGTPTLFISVTPAGKTPFCKESAHKAFSDWDEFINNQSSGSANIPGYNGDFAFSVVFNRLIEFKDTSYKASKRFNSSDLANNGTYRPVNLSGLDWTFDDGKLVGKEPDNSNNTQKKFTWTIQLYVPDKPGRVSSFPKTLYSENSTVFDFVFSNFEYTISTDQKDSQVEYGRLVLEMLLVHSRLVNRTVQRVFSRDDEYTPSVFLTYNQLFGGNQSMNGFLQWKPISYLSHKRKSTQSQQANIINKSEQQIKLAEVSRSLVTALYSNDSEAGIIQPVYMVYGTDGDDNNLNPGYVTWTGMLGFGTPPQDKISSVVILTICIGLGVPALLIGLGGVFLFIRRKPWKKFTSKAPKGYTKLDVNGSYSK